MSIVLNFYQERPFLLKKIYKAIKAKKANEGQQANKDQHSPKLQNLLLLSLFNVKSSKNVNMIPEKCLFKKLKNLFSQYIKSLKLHFVENVDLVYLLFYDRV
jgi:hypothetical protein